ncbi:hypothetical protein PYV02_06670 [Leifsonia sp. H3M29-4]|uniref:hypothetical protein n=1 Tax=Salinibacterium metalliresistens TaxID=3031321 RepID=UPI0023D98B34|nr:hypothetical protein [Salinibacterium metalliresistens]MDF1478766.1 hypothetical protein [Salinibacterium metalliresistens]
MLFDRRFDVVELGEGRVAGAILVAAAKEVPVLIAVPVDCALLDEASVGVPLQSAVPAPEASLQVMGVDASTFAGDGSRFEDALYDVEEIRLDQRGVTSLEHFVLV